jgi:hypothetical protein
MMLLTWASAPWGSLPRPRVCWRLDFSSSESTSKPTPTLVTPSSSATWVVTASWKWDRTGHPGVVSETTTSMLST